MTEQERNDLVFVCALIESVGRSTNNRRGDVVKQLGLSGLRKLLNSAGVNHCLPMEQITDEVSDFYSVSQGDFDTVDRCRYKVPGITSIGKVYARLIEAVHDPDTPIEETMFQVFTSFISDAISNFNTSTYYSSPDYLKHSYLAGELLP